MSHEIETHGSQAAAVFARKDAWHRLGTTVRDALSRESAGEARRPSVTLRGCRIDAVVMSCGMAVTA